MIRYLTIVSLAIIATLAVAACTRDIVKEVQVEVPGETVVVEREVVKAEVPVEVVVEKEVVREVEVPGETVVVESQGATGPAGAAGAAGEPGPGPRPGMARWRRSYGSSASSFGRWA